LLHALEIRYPRQNCVSAIVAFLRQACCDWLAPSANDLADNWTHFADAEHFVSVTNTPAGAPSVHVARRADSYAISVDTLGKLQWTKNAIDGDHIICVLSERVPTDYLTMLRGNGISYIVAGQHSVDLVQAVNILAEHFEIRTLQLEGGGHINGGFKRAWLMRSVFSFFRALMVDTTFLRCSTVSTQPITMPFLSKSSLLIDETTIPSGFGTR
jgi:hypothetical protein